MKPARFVLNRFLAWRDMSRTALLCTAALCVAEGRWITAREGAALIGQSAETWARTIGRLRNAGLCAIETLPHGAGKQRHRYRATPLAFSTLGLPQP